MPSDKCNLITTKTMGLSFHCSMSLRPERCLLAYRSILHGLASVLHCVPFISLLIAKSVNLAVACDSLEVVHIFHSGYFDCRGAFQTFLDS